MYPSDDNFLEATPNGSMVERLCIESVNSKTRSDCPGMICVVVNVGAGNHRFHLNADDAEALAEILVQAAQAKRGAS